MKRRDFLKSTLFFAAISTVAGKVSNVLAADVFVTAGKLGYKDPSPKAKDGKMCGTCKYYKTTGAGVGDCTLPAMKSAMKSPTTPKVKEGAYCNMWMKKA